ncbi:MAG: hydroxymethylbilane synthase [Gammaproteobacteria bacterium]|nr:hydroxymethylbilane synthase [Gammaproteobacteria bacterium]
MKIRIATRASKLALVQTNEVIEKIKHYYPTFKYEIIKIESDGDLTNEPLHEIGGKGLFVSKLEMALSNNTADIAVHSLKDVPALLDSQFKILATLPREEAGDAILFKNDLTIDDLSKNLKIATSGPRRRAQLLAINPQLNIVPIRGNIQTRIDKMNVNAIDGLIIARAALNRLNIEHQNIYYFSEEEMLPAAAQGAIGIEVHANRINSEIGDVLKFINDRYTYQATEIERAVVASLEGNCLSPISVLCKINGQNTELKVRVSNQSGLNVYDQRIIFKLKNKNEALEGLIGKLISNGAKEIINH